MKFHLSLFFSIFTFLSISQTSVRLDNAIDRIKKTEPYIPEEANLSYEQKTLLRKRNDQKIKAEITLLDSKYILDSCYMTTLVDSVINILKSANPGISPETEAFIYRSTDFNAFTMGEDILFINADLVFECRNPHELATILAHEIAHNTLKHSAKEQIKMVQFITNDSIQKELRSASRMEYGQATALNSLMFPKILSDQKESRQQESDADSLGLSYIIAAGFDPARGAKVFEILMYYGEANSGEMDFSKLKPEIRDILVSKEKGYSRGNSLGFTQKITDEWEPYLRSHPYSKDRYIKLLQIYSLNENTLTILNDKGTRLKLYTEMSKIAFRLGALTRYEFITIQNSDLGAEVSDNCAFGFFALGFLKERYVVGKYLDRQDLAQPEDYDRMCYILNNCSGTNFYAMANLIKPQFSFSSPDLTIEEMIIGILDLVKAEDTETLKLIWKLHSEELRTSPYSWFVTQIEDYLYTAKRCTFVKQIN